MDKYLLRQSDCQSHSKSDSDSNTCFDTVSNENEQVQSIEEESFSDSSEGAVCKQRRKRMRNVFKQKFKSTWLTNHNKTWLTEVASTGEAQCQVCNKVLIGGITHVNRHSNSTSHIRRMKALSATPKITTLVTERAEEKRLKDGIKEAEIKLVMFLAEHNLPFNLLEHLPKFLRSVCYDSQLAKHLQCGRKKGTKLCSQIIGPEHLHQVSEALKETWFSLIIDESTDVSSQKCLAVIARYYNGKIVKDEYLGLVAVESGTADSLFTSTKKLIEENHIPITNMIGFAADNASVMQGNINSVQARFKEEISDIFVFGCVCHSLALCSRAACKKLPTSVEKLAGDIVSYFAHSSKRQNELKEYQQFIDANQHKLLKLSNTRWLSLQAVVDRIIEQWQSLTLFFTNEVYDKNCLINPQLILEALRNPVFKLYFSFLSYILDVVNTMNLEFQSESPKVHLLYNRMTGLFKSILKNFIKSQYLNNVATYNEIQFLPCNYKTLDEIYCGANCEVIISNVPIDKTELECFKLKCLEFYIELSRQIISRFNFNDNVLKFMQNFEPSVAVSGVCESLVPLAARFPKLVSNLEKLNSEWRLLSDMPEVKTKAHKPLMEFWSYIFNLRNGLNDLMFPNLTNFVKGLLCLPHSSATVERIFSQLSLIKTKNRNKLNISTCNYILHTKFLLQNCSCYDFQPSPSLMSRKYGDVITNVSENNENEEITF